MAGGEGVDVVALLVSLSALVIAAGQLLQQIFGTAEGYRSCNASVIGPWAKTRHRSLHLRELRMETTFQTPEFRLVEDKSDGLEPFIEDRSQASSSESARPMKLRKSYVYLVDGSRRSLAATYASDETDALYETVSETSLPFFEPVSEKVRTIFSKDDNSNPSRGDPMSMAVGWLSFLQKLHEHEKKYEALAFQPLSSEGNLPGKVYRSKSAVRRVQRSWDFMPADVLRPLASTQFGDLLILCYRMRIRWYDLHLGQRSLRAEGWGHSFTLIDIRGLGFVFEYRFGGSNLAALRNDGNDHPANRHFVPSRHADKLAFGLIPADDKLIIGHEHFDLGGEDYFASIIEMHETLGVGPTMLEDFRGHRRDWRNLADEYFHVSNEALYMLAPFIPLYDMEVVKIQPPFQHRFGSMCTFREGRLVLHTRLRKCIESKSHPLSAQLQHVYKVLDHLATDSYTKDEFQRAQGFKDHIFAKNAKTSESRALLSYLHVEFDKTTQCLQQTVPSGCYTDLVASHLEMAFKAQKTGKRKEKKNQRIEVDYDDMNPIFTEIAHLYVENAEAGSIYDAFLKRYKAKTTVSRDRAADNKDPALPSSSDIRDAWWTMMLRSFLWDLSIVPIGSPGLPVLSNLYGDTTPVWIA